MTINITNGGTGDTSDGWNSLSDHQKMDNLRRAVIFLLSYVGTKHLLDSKVETSIKSFAEFIDKLE